MSLNIKFGIFFLASALVVIAVSSSIGWELAQAQAEREMLETAEVLSREMDSIWDFMEHNQNQFVTKPDGTYRLYCVVAAKSVSKLFSANSDYEIHYTNATTRKDDDAPDDFELEALAAFQEDPELASYYELTSDEQGRATFRYVQPIFLTQSCLECHGKPAGELDMMGYPKEGRELGDLAGAASISMPAATFLDAAQSQAVVLVVTVAIISICGLLVLFWSISHFVTRPMRAMAAAAERIERHEFDARLESIAPKDEIGVMTDHFNSMAEELQGYYRSLEAQVRERTLELEEANELLQRQGESRSAFFAIMAHELRTPLTSIVAFSDIWDKKYAPRDENEAKIVHATKTNSLVMMRLVHNILALARLEEGRTELSLDSIDMVDLVGHSMSALTPLAQRKDLSLTCHVDLDVPFIEADEEKLQSIVDNLVSNAVKFSEKGGAVRATVVLVPFDEAIGGQAVRLTIEDEGCGIPPEDLACMFDQFFQAGTGGKHVGGGSGLGLFIVRSFAELHHGRVEVASAPGRGSAFSVYLPVSQTRRPAEDAEGANEEGGDDGDGEGTGARAGEEGRDEHPARR